MHGMGFLAVTLCVISLVLAIASPPATLALKVSRSNAYFSPIIPFFKPAQNISGPAAALQGPGAAAAIAKALQSPANANGPGPAALQGPAAALQGPGAAAAIAKALQSSTNATNKTSIQIGFLSKGTINSLIRTPTSNWIATGNWSMSVDNGSLTGFGTNMTWYNSNGKASHTHEFRDLRAGAGSIQGNNIIINGLMDVGTNHRVVWKNVPTTINIEGGKTIRISVADNATNHHFAGQPVFGLVSSFTPCSDVPGPNMEVLPSCQK
jgi:hypothetical protein